MYRYYVFHNAEILSDYSVTVLIEMRLHSISRLVRSVFQVLLYTRQIDAWIHPLRAGKAVFWLYGTGLISEDYSLLVGMWNRYLWIYSHRDNIL